MNNVVLQTVENLIRYQNNSPDMVMSRDSAFKFLNFYSSSDSVLNFRKS